MAVLLRTYFILCLGFIAVTVEGQQISLTGFVKDTTGISITGAHVRIEGTRTGTFTDREGYFKLTLPGERAVRLNVSSIGYESQVIEVTPYEQPVIITLTPSETSISEVKVEASERETGTMQQISIRDFSSLPAPTGNLETLIKTLPGVSSRNELSSQYSVRGGNFDENLVYINGIEVYRPVLIRAGRQEGLSIINPDLVEDVRFSAGGFPARYGDKMSSVLDIRYRTPSTYRTTLSAGFLGGSVHTEGIAAKHRFTYLTGFRYHTNQYLLGALDTRGEYKPSFTDFQGLFTWHFSGKTSLDLFSSISGNRYRFIPRDRTTSFGTVRNAVQLKVFYEGNEKDFFDIFLGALTLHYNPEPHIRLNFTGSAFNTSETETYDIDSYYLLNALDKQLGSETFGDSIMNIGIGRDLRHARNLLNGRILSLQHDGQAELDHSLLRWGLTWHTELLDDKRREWTLRDSAGYAIPYNGETVTLNDVVISETDIISNRISGYVEEDFEWQRDSAFWQISAGIRAQYWDFNRQAFLSPRVQVSFRPSPGSLWRYHFAIGAYQQSPMFKEFRLPGGSVNRNILAQRSVHVVAGFRRDFTAWGRPFLWTGEAYYKLMDRLIPYFQDNVRIDYTGQNQARGYTYGLDTKVYGEFVKGVDSWASLSLMQSREDVTGDFYMDENRDRVYPGYYPRPTDQLVNFGLSFRDYLPGNPTFRVHLTMFYSTGLPVRPPETERYDLFFRMPSYKRVDIGFSKVFIDNTELADQSPFSGIKKLWVGLDIFNLLGINNTISYLWVQTVNNLSHESGVYGVPNYLTSRRFNLRVVMEL
ncbi:MAG: TonB-dependent receptor plug domain-containing protein [Chlorobi bacterium]|nr:TonB-dependent receptor plug domain-containing protein [Chlorobiota bacterium]